MLRLTHRALERKRPLSLRSALLFAGIGMLLLSSSALAYNFTYFGGRQGRPGVDSRYFLYTWNRGPTGGTLTWYLVRGELTYGLCDATCFGILNSLVPPELAKWALWIDLSFAQAPDSASADVIIRFSNETGGADAQAWQYDSLTGTLTQALIRINPNVIAGFSFIVLHEWGHCLGLGDLYYINHGVNTFEAEDFTDHNPSDPSLPNTQGKSDNVMQTNGVMTLDNDEIYAAQWLWGNIGANAITTGDLQPRVSAPMGGDNANQTAPHHGQPTWTYWGTVTNPVGPTVVSLRLPNLCTATASSIGPGVWNVAYFPERIEWTTAGPYQGNFVFQLSDTFSTGSESRAWANVDTTSFNRLLAAPPPPPPPPPDWPVWPGPQLFPHPGVFGMYGPCGADIWADTLRPGSPVSVVGPVSTCGLVDNCDLRVGEEVVIRVIVDSAAWYTFSLCGAATWDTYIYLFADYCGGEIIASNDDGCGVAAGASVITCQYLNPGTYYLDIEPATSGECGDFTLTISACSTPCDTAIRADSVTISLNQANTNVVIGFRAPVAGEYTVWSTTSRNAVFPTGFIPLDTVTATPGFNSWTDPDALFTYRRYAVTHTCP